MPSRRCGFSSSIEPAAAASARPAAIGRRRIRLARATAARTMVTAASAPTSGPRLKEAAIAARCPSTVVVHSGGTITGTVKRSGSCPGGGPVALVGGGNRPGVDFLLDVGGSITGTITDAPTGALLP